MALLCPAVGENEILKILFGQASPPSNYTLRLFTNDATITDATELTDLTECSVTSYSSFSTTNGSWVVATSSGTTSASYAMHTFTFGGSVTVYGWYMTDNASSKLYLVEKFAAPFTYSSDGGNLDLTVTFTLE